MSPQEAMRRAQEARASLTAQVRRERGWEGYVDDIARDRPKLTPVSSREYIPGAPTSEPTVTLQDRGARFVEGLNRIMQPVDPSTYREQGGVGIPGPAGASRPGSLGEVISTGVTQKVIQVQKVLKKAREGDPIPGPASGPAPGSAGEKVQEVIKKTIVEPAGRLGTAVEFVAQRQKTEMMAGAAHVEAEAMKLRDRDMVAAIATMSVAQLMRLGAGAWDTMTFPFRPRQWQRSAEGIGQLITASPAERYRMMTAGLTGGRPHEALAVFGGQLLGGYALSAAASKLGARLNRPQYETRVVTDRLGRPYSFKPGKGWQGARQTTGPGQAGLVPEYIKLKGEWFQTGEGLSLVDDMIPSSRITEVYKLVDPKVPSPAAPKGLSSMPGSTRLRTVTTLKSYGGTPLDLTPAAQASALLASLRTRDSVIQTPEASQLQDWSQYQDRVMREAAAQKGLQEQAVEELTVMGPSERVIQKPEPIMPGYTPTPTITVPIQVPDLRQGTMPGNTPRQVPITMPMTGSLPMTEEMVEQVQEPGRPFMPFTYGGPRFSDPGSPRSRRFRPLEGLGLPPGARRITRTGRAQKLWDVDPEDILKLGRR